jgi:hypothetical protein
MKLALWLILLPVILAGCLGGGSGHAASGRTNSGPTSTHNPLTVLRVSYPVGRFVLQRSQLASCPSDATCHDAHIACLPTGCPASPRPWIRVAVRRLTCSPSGGDYPDPGAACAALDDLEHRLGTQPAVICDCLQIAGRSPQAVGRYKGYGVKIALDGCSLCGLGTQAAQDAAVLMPQ